MDRQFLRESQFTKQNILQNVLAPHNFNGEHANSDIEALVREERSRKLSRFYVLPSMGGILFSAFNLTRMSQLSPSGRGAALFGTLFFSYTTLVFIQRSRGTLAG